LALWRTAKIPYDDKLITFPLGRFEARMLSDAMKKYRYFAHGLAVMLMLATFVFGGCRGSNPFGKYVKVTHEPDADLADIEAPNQRLVTNEPKTPSSGSRSNKDSEIKLAGANETQEAKQSSHSDADQTSIFGRLTARDGVEKNRRVAMPDDPVSKSPATQRGLPPVRTVTRETSTNQSKTNEMDSKDAVASQTPAPTSARTRKLSQADYEQIMAAFAEYPPEVRQEAMKRLAVVMADSAPKTEQPSTLQDSLESQLSNLPELPPSKRDSKSPPLVRPGSESKVARNEASKNASPIAKSTVSSQSMVVQEAPLISSVGDKPSVSKRRVETSKQSVVAATKKSEPATASLSDLVSADTQSFTHSETSQKQDTPAPQPEVQVTSATTKMPGQVETALDMRSMVSKPPTSVLEFDESPAEPAPVATTDLKSNQAAPVKAISLPAGADKVAQSLPAPSESVAPESKPVVDPTQLDDKSLYAALVKKLATEPKGETPAARTSRLIKLRHLMVLSGDPDSAVEKIDGMTNAEQEYLRHQLLGLWTMVDPNGHPVHQRRLSNAIGEYRQATRYAAAATDSLEVRSLAFCTEIESYGQIKRFEGNRFKGGQAVILYSEIDNFTALEVEGGFSTQLQGSYEIYDAGNKKVHSQLLPVDKQTSANYLRDYFIAYQMHLPTGLPKGTYRLQLTMEDVNAKKYGQASIPLEIVE
jgi:hypothetical protein